MMMEDVLKVVINFFGRILAILYSGSLVACFIYKVTSVGYQNLMILIVLTIGMVCGMAFYIVRENRDSLWKGPKEQKLYQSFLVHIFTAWALVWVQAARTLDWFTYLNF